MAWLGFDRVGIEEDFGLVALGRVGRGQGGDGVWDAAGAGPELAGSVPRHRRGGGGRPARHRPQWQRRPPFRQPRPGKTPTPAPKVASSGWGLGWVGGTWPIKTDDPRRIPLYSFDQQKCSGGDGLGG